MINPLINILRFMILKILKKLNKGMIILKYLIKSIIYNRLINIINIY